ncbi:MAG: 1-acyl-sn-glycerol-3-phosphate acyltransferase [Holosporales bacterium]|jgi:1-acyl-sn-glycerol-3-phosphate acyltransferase|nr:1-acyl-sn-glycerol-3-phosphate acyltransferase [Holosporales bacterium]
MLRSLLFNIAFWPVFIMYILIMYPLAAIVSPRNVLLLVYRPVTRWLLFCLKKIADVGYEIRNTENVPSGPCIIGCNHHSTWETFIFSLLFDNLSIVIKRELLRKPIAGLYFKRLGCIPIDRSSPVLAIKTLVKYGMGAHQAGHNILIFPNGTRDSSGAQAEYKGGIYAIYKATGAPVVPVSVNSGSHWPRRSFRKIPGTIVLDFKEAIPPGLEKAAFFAEFETRMEQR